MTISANTVLEVRNGGSDTNGGGFVTGASGTDWSQQTAAQYSVTDGVTAGTTTITSATAAFGTDVVGNLIYVQGGTGSVVAGWYEITARASATSITVDRSTGLTAGTGVTLKIGGALASPGMASGIMVGSGNGGICYIQYNATPYLITSATVNISGGCIAPNQDKTYFVGYDTTRALYTPFQNRPTLKVNTGVTSAKIFNADNVFARVQGLILDGNSQTGSQCARLNAEFLYVKIMNYMAAGIDGNQVGQIICILVEATAGGADVGNISCGVALWTTSHHNYASAGFFSPGMSVSLLAYGCISYSNNYFGFSAGSAGRTINCIAYGNGQHGFFLDNANNLNWSINCISENNGAYGFFNNSGWSALINCADRNNTSGRKNSGSGWKGDISPVTGSSSFFNNAASGDFGLNSTAGAGAAARAVGFPVSSTGFPGLSSTQNYRDLGAIQHQDAGGGSSGPVAQLKTFGRGSPY